MFKELPTPVITQHASSNPLSLAAPLPALAIPLPFLLYCTPTCLIVPCNLTVERLLVATKTDRLSDWSGRPHTLPSETFDSLDYNDVHILLYYIHNCLVVHILY
ncbi:hypothetical protein EB796_002061 [Bugula neritina]|uniref:Uncharacterized protein n=1 Tax=Bugula neritina TaxID=10212 RepID=A0A7J7KNC6_BUGNE|nr:hypothetical protein EB796_002061 [Bugula neritina]